MRPVLFTGNVSDTRQATSYAADWANWQPRRVMQGHMVENVSYKEKHRSFTMLGKLARAVTGSCQSDRIGSSVPSPTHTRTPPHPEAMVKTGSLLV